jgi:hypothetical protein
MIFVSHMFPPVTVTLQHFFLHLHFFSPSLSPLFLSRHLFLAFFSLLSSLLSHLFPPDSLLFSLSLRAVCCWSKWLLLWRICWRRGRGMDGDSACCCLVLMRVLFDVYGGIWREIMYCVQSMCAQFIVITVTFKWFRLDKALEICISSWKEMYLIILIYVP